MALARAALSVTDEVLFVLPRVFPHKHYERATIEDRVRLLLAATADEPRYSVAASAGGLFLDIARECRVAYSPEVEIWILCGRDAAERAIHWPYPEGQTFAAMLEEFGLLVADREGVFVPPPSLAPRIRKLPVDPSIDEISATEVRTLIAEGKPWRHLVPESIVEIVSEIYV